MFSYILALIFTDIAGQAKGVVKKVEGAITDNPEKKVSCHESLL